MEEKILIKSEVDKKIKAIVQILFITMLTISAFSFLILLMETEILYYHSGYYIGKYWIQGYEEYIDVNGYEILFGDYNANFEDYALRMVLFIIACTLFVGGITLLIIHLAISKCQLEITEKSAKGKTFFGKEVVLPMYMVSAYSTRKFLSTIAVATSSGITKFVLIKNYAEIGNVLSQKINERQENTVNQPIANTAASQGNPMDDLKKLKELFDAGIITQEEFDIKKKQLLDI